MALKLRGEPAHLVVGAGACRGGAPGRPCGVRAPWPRSAGARARSPRAIPRSRAPPPARRRAAATNASSTRSAVEHAVDLVERARDLERRRPPMNVSNGTVSTRTCTPSTSESSRNWPASPAATASVRGETGTSTPRRLAVVTCPARDELDVPGRRAGRRGGSARERLRRAARRAAGSRRRRPRRAPAARRRSPRGAAGGRAPTRARRRARRQRRPPRRPRHHQTGAQRHGSRST